jgi:hypothetical protein
MTDCLSGHVTGANRAQRVVLLVQFTLEAATGVKSFRHRASGPLVTRDVDLLRATHQADGLSREFATAWGSLEHRREGNGGVVLNLRA